MSNSLLEASAVPLGLGTPPVRTAGAGPTRSLLESSSVPLGLSAEPIAGAPPAGRTLALTMQHQRQTQWCWAAVTSSIATFFRLLTWSQCRLANDQLGQVSCCGDGSTSACNKPWYLDRALGRVGMLAVYTTGALAASDVRTQIYAGRPIGVRIGWSGGGGHFVAIGGYTDPGLLDVMDPWFGRSTVDYSTFRSRYQGVGQWTHSYRTKPSGAQNATPTCQAST